MGTFSTWQKAIGAIVIAATAGFMLSGAQGRTTNLNDRILAAHNRERSGLGVASLEWDVDLATGAQEWAEHLSRTGRFHHSPDPGTSPEGENIWGGTPDSFTPEAMVGLWTAEKRHFKQGTFPENSATGNAADVGHYTQLIWRDTRRVGCGLSGAGSREILVCRYSAPGNIIGRRPL